jgi:hypothetical protein
MATDKIAGFDAQRWQLFLAPIPLAFLYKAPVGGALYVKHQYCVEMLNKAFGVDGWTNEDELVSDKDQYVDLYHAKDAGGQPAFDGAGDPVFKKKLGRKFAVVKCRLTICAPGHPCPVYHEDFGSQVAAADWSEAIKGAASEALKRAASRFGFAAEVYKTEEIEGQFGEDWETAILPTYAPPWELPMNQSIAICEWMNALGWDAARQESELACVTSQATAANLGWELNWVLKTARPDAQEFMGMMDMPATEQEHVLSQIVDVKSAKEIVTRLKAEAAQVTDFSQAVAGGAEKGLFDGKGSE